MNRQYDYIIAGAGASGLSLAWKLMQSSLADKNILIIDTNLEARHNKTWCFWESDTPPFTDIIHKKWDHVEVSVFDDRFRQSLNRYPYYCVRSSDFREKIVNAARSDPRFDLREMQVSGFSSDDDNAVLHTQQDTYHAEYIFQSCFNPWKDKLDNPRFPLIQHFLGWEVQLSEPLFDASTFTLMDFDNTFRNGMAFIYLLPWSEKSGLIEYTIFSDHLVSEAFYEEKLYLYLNNRFGLKPFDYQIQRKEFGKIPMQDRPHLPWLRPRILNLGTSGGLTKPSTGYTFRRIQEQTEAVVNGLESDGTPQYPPPSEKRFKAYDLWLLQIMHDHPNDALRVFGHLFDNNTMDEIFQFLAEESNFLQDLKIMSSVPYFPFLRAIWKTRDRLREI